MVRGKRLLKYGVEQWQCMKASWFNGRMRKCNGIAHIGKLSIDGLCGDRGNCITTPFAATAVHYDLVGSEIGRQLGINDPNMRVAINRHVHDCQHW